MKKIMFALAALVIAVPTLAKPTTEINAQDGKAIRARFQDLQKTFNAKDNKAFAALFSEDGDIIDPAGISGKGRPAIEKVVQGDMDHFLMDGKSTFLVTGVRFLKPDVAIVNATHQVTGITGPDGKKMPPMKVLVTCVMEKEGDVWYFAAARPMVPVMAPAAPKDSMDGKKETKPGKM